MFSINGHDLNMAGNVVAWCIFLYTSWCVVDTTARYAGYLFEKFFIS